MNSPVNSSPDAIVFDQPATAAPTNPQWILDELIPGVLRGRYDVIAMSAELIAEIRLVDEAPGEAGFKLGLLDQSVPSIDPKKPAKNSWLGITAETLDKFNAMRGAASEGLLMQEIRMGLADATKWQLRDKCRTDDARAHFDRQIAPMPAMTAMLDLEEALQLQFQAMHSAP